MNCPKCGAVSANPKRCLACGASLTSAKPKPAEPAEPVVSPTSAPPPSTGHPLICRRTIIASCLIVGGIVGVCFAESHAPVRTFNDFGSAMTSGKDWFLRPWLFYTILTVAWSLIVVGSIMWIMTLLQVYGHNLRSVVATAQVASVGDPLEMIQKAKCLMDSGAITQEEFDKIKAEQIKKVR